MSAQASRLTTAIAYVRAHGVKVGAEAAVNFILPFLIYTSSSGSLGSVPALMAASVPPILWSVVEFVRAKRVDAISVIVLSGIALSLLAFAGGGGVKFLQLRENLVAGLVGLLFLGSAAIGRPLMYYLARAGLRRRAADKVPAFELLRHDAGFRGAMTVATLMWGLGLLAACALNCALVFLLSIGTFLLISAPITYATIASLTAWTFWYVPRAKRLAEARLANISPAGPPA